MAEEETTLVDGYMENKVELTCELKGAINITGKNTAKMKEEIWQKITNAINWYPFIENGKFSLNLNPPYLR